MSDLRLAAARDQEKFFYRSGPSDSSSPTKQHLQLGEQPRKAEAGRRANQGGFIIANQNGNASPSGARVLIITRRLLL